MDYRTARHQTDELGETLAMLQRLPAAELMTAEQHDEEKQLLAVASKMAKGIQAGIASREQEAAKAKAAKAKSDKAKAASGRGKDDEDDEED